MTTHQFPDFHIEKGDSAEVLAAEQRAHEPSLDCWCDPTIEVDTEENPNHPLMRVSYRTIVHRHGRDTVGRR